ncbi:MAG: hypothetical protein JWL69_1654 [Phycisphaerales bacterium]|nr:hypothetical protein [Phycisphaerales bacterium]
MGVSASGLKTRVEFLSLNLGKLHCLRLNCEAVPDLFYEPKFFLGGKGQDISH